MITLLGRRELDCDHLAGQEGAGLWSPSWEGGSWIVITLLGRRELDMITLLGRRDLDCDHLAGQEGAGLWSLLLGRRELDCDHLVGKEVAGLWSPFGNEGAGLWSPCWEGVSWIVITLLGRRELDRDHFVGKEGAGCFAFLWFEECVLSVVVCIFFLLASLIGYVAFPGQHHENMPI